MSLQTGLNVDLLTQQGISALQSNNKLRACEILSQAVQLAPYNEQAWLWLSGAVATDGERRYCLEQVLVINPRNSAAQRGMALLPVVLPVSPLGEGPPARPEPTHTLEAQPAQWEFATTTAIAAGSLLELIATPKSAASSSASAELESRFFSEAATPQVVSYAPPPAEQLAAQATRPSAECDPAIVDFVIRELGRHRSRDEIIRELSTQHRLAWGDAQELMAKVERGNRTKIARRQSPFFIFLGVTTLIGGLLLVGRGVLVLYALYFSTTHGMIRIPNPQALGVIVAQMFTGIAMVAGSLVGLGQTIKGLFK